MKARFTPALFAHAEPAVAATRPTREIKLSIGEPQHATPRLITEALAQHLSGLASYPTTQGSDALAAYASALSSLAIEDIPSAVQHLQHGLERPQAIPALEQDMARVLQQLLEREKQAEATDSGTHGASFLLSNYGRQH